MSSYLFPCTLKPLWRAVWNPWLHLTSFTVQFNIFLEVLNSVLLIMVHQTHPVRTSNPPCCKIQTLLWPSYLQPLSSRHISLWKYSTYGIFCDFSDPTLLIFLQVQGIFCWWSFPAHPTRLVFICKITRSDLGPLFPPSNEFYSSHTFLSLLCAILLIVYTLWNHRPVITKTCFFSPILLPLLNVNCNFSPFNHCGGHVFLLLLFLICN